MKISISSGRMEGWEERGEDGDRGSPDLGKGGHEGFFQEGGSFPRQAGARGTVRPYVDPRSSSTLSRGWWDLEGGSDRLKRGLRTLPAHARLPMPSDCQPRPRGRCRNRPSVSYVDGLGRSSTGDPPTLASAPQIPVRFPIRVPIAPRTTPVPPSRSWSSRVRVRTRGLPGLNPTDPRFEAFGLPIRWGGKPEVRNEVISTTETVDIARTSASLDARRKGHGRRERDEEVVETIPIQEDEGLGTR